ncbi:MAG: hypothetical protein Q7U75_05620, partial [Desulfobacterales bacterium]|nr:hypothetical protein [Desulfobacterales bacterium]
DSPVELDYLGVAGADLDVDLRAAHLPQSGFGFRFSRRYATISLTRPISPLSKRTLIPWG